MGEYSTDQIALKLVHIIYVNGMIDLKTYQRIIGRYAA
jgi:hypothetical protein